MNPAKLKSYVDSEAQNPDVSGLVGMPANPDDVGGEDDDWDEETPNEPADPTARGNELLGSWGERGMALKEAAGEIVDGAHEIGGDLLLGQVPEEAVDEVHAQFDRMPDDIQVSLAQLVAPLSDADLAALATVLIDGHDGETKDADVKLVAAYIKSAAAYAKEEVDPSNFVEDEEDEDEEEDGDGDAPPPTAAGTSASPVESASKPLA